MVAIVMAYIHLLIYISTPILSLAFSVFKPKILIFRKTTKDFLIVKTKCEFLDKICCTTKQNPLFTFILE